jgi:hypothetical protein
MGRPNADDAATVEYLYVPCVGVRHNGYRAETRRWVQEVPIVKKTAKWIYYASDSWNRREAIVSPGCISREQFEADTRSGPRGEGRGRHGYPAGVIPVPGDDHRPGSAGPLFFATREAAEEDLFRGKREQARRAAREAALRKELRRAVADSHPDRGGTVDQFIEAHRRYQAVLQGR